MQHLDNSLKRCPLGHSIWRYNLKGYNLSQKCHLISAYAGFLKHTLS